MGRMLAKSLFLCFLIGSILQGSLCDDSNSNLTDNDTSKEDNGASKEDKTAETSNSSNFSSDKDVSKEDKDVSKEDNYVSNEASETSDADNDNYETGTAPSNVGADDQTAGYGNKKKGCGSKKEGTKIQGEGTKIQGEDDCNSDEDTSFADVDNVHQYQEDVTLDPKTAHPVLYLSEDLKSVSFGSSKQDLDNNTERFDSDPCVLGATGYTSGKHFFKASGDGGFLVGFLGKSVHRKGPLVLSPDAGIFAYPRAMGDTPDIVGSLLDCDQKQVLFYDESNNEVVSNLVMPNGCSEEMIPFVFLGAGKLKIS